MSEQMDERFFVDERCGCIAVRDRTLTDPDYQGLHEDTTGVVWFRMGEKSLACPTCGSHRGSAWTISESLRREAQALCDDAARGRDMSENNDALIGPAKVAARDK